MDFLFMEFEFVSLAEDMFLVALVILNGSHQANILVRAACMRCPLLTAFYSLFLFLSPRVTFLPERVIVQGDILALNIFLFAISYARKNLHTSSYTQNFNDKFPF